jgi:GT2 family glycosyltransferase
MQNSHIEPFVSIVICNFNGAEVLLECLKSLIDQQYERKEIIVVDNGSTDASVEVLKSLGVKFFEMGTNRGMARAFNVGSSIAKGDLLFFVSEDMRFDKGCIGSLVEEFLSIGPSLFAADPMQLDWLGEKVIHGVTTVGPGKIASWLPFFRVSFVDGAPRRAFVPWACAGSIMVRGNMFRELGGFDGAFFLDMEDIDICSRAWMRGWKTVFTPRGYLYHRVGLGASKMVAPKGWRQVSAERNMMRFALKTMNIKKVLMFVVAKTSLFALLSAKGDPRSYWIARSFTWNVTNLKSTWLRRKSILLSSVKRADEVLLEFSRGKVEKTIT